MKLGNGHAQGGRTPSDEIGHSEIGGVDRIVEVDHQVLASLVTRRLVCFHDKEHFAHQVTAVRREQNGGSPMMVMPFAPCRLGQLYGWSKRHD